GPRSDAVETDPAGRSRIRRLRPRNVARGVTVRDSHRVSRIHSGRARSSDRAARDGLKAVPYAKRSSFIRPFAPRTFGVVPALVFVLPGIADVGTFAAGFDADDVARLGAAVVVRTRVGFPCPHHVAIRMIGPDRPRGTRRGGSLHPDAHIARPSGTVG